MNRKSIPFIALLMLSACGLHGAPANAPDSDEQALTGYTMRWDFETTAPSVSVWQVSVGGSSANKCAQCTISRVVADANGLSSSPIYEGTGAMKVHLLADNDTDGSKQLHLQTFSPGNAPTNPNSYVVYHMWIPKNAPVRGIHAYAKHGSGYVYSDTYLPGVDPANPGGNPNNVLGDSWTTFYVPYPVCSSSLVEIGFDMSFSASWEDDIYIDSLAW